MLVWFHAPARGGLPDARAVGSRTGAVKSKACRVCDPLRMSQEEDSIRGQGVFHPWPKLGLRLQVKIDDDIPAKDDVKPLAHGPARQKVQFVELDHLGQNWFCGKAAF